MRKDILLLFLAVLISSTQGWGSNNKDKVLLEKVTAITLEEGRMTNARRSSAIPQLECVGGSAGCYGYRPKVVQCINAGFDGYDVQWECKTEMDSKYRFGKIDVSCEGYDHRDDPYVLRGSCGLRYELDLTEEGHRHKKNSFGSSHHHHHSSSDSSSSSSSWFGTLIQLVIIGAIIYCCLGACMGGRRHGSHSGGDYSSSYGSSATHHHYHHGNSGPGFWSGAATGGTLGYLFGNRRGGYGTSSWGSGGGGWSSGSSGWSSSRSSGSSSRSTSRSTSGYGGTSRR